MGLSRDAPCASVCGAGGGQLISENTAGGPGGLGDERLERWGGPASTEFVGRGRECAWLGAVLQRVADPGEGADVPPVVIINGEAGVGKSRLVRQLVQTADEQGFRTATGCCLDLGTGRSAYAPFLTALRDLGCEVDLARLEQGHTSPARGEGTGRLPDHLVDLLASLAADAPLVVVLEDLHWADESTLDLLLQVASRVERAPLLLLCTCRSDDVGRGRRLRRLQAELLRARRAAVINLAPFDVPETRTLLTGILGRDPGAKIATEVHDRAGGNAYYVEELALGAASGLGLPDSLRDVLLARVEQLPPTGREVLTVLATLGRPTRQDLLLALFRSGERDWVTAVRDAVDRRIVVLDEENRTYAVRHALLGEAVYGDLLPVERERLHAAVAAALEAAPELAADDAAAAAECAHHWRRAREPKKALAAAISAAQRALARYGFAEALVHYESALDLWGQVRDPSYLIGLQLPDVLLAAAEAANLHGEHRRAAEYVQRALDDAGRGGDAHGEARLQARLGRFLWAAADPERALQAYERAAALVEAAGPSALKAAVTASRAQAFMLLSQFDTAVTLAREAMATALRVGARQEEGHARNTLGFSLVQLGHESEGLASSSVRRPSPARSMTWTTWPELCSTGPKR